MTDKEIEVIVKPIFTKMFNSNFSACEYGIECYKKGMEYQGIKELAIENDNLIKRNTELEEENAELKEKREQDCDSSWYEGFNCSEKERLKQLTKAKEIIKKFLLWENDWHNKTESKYELLKQAEQFLNSEVEK